MVVAETPRVVNATPRPPLTLSARFTPRTPGRIDMLEWEIPQPDHPLPKLDLPKNKTLKGEHGRYENKIAAGKYMSEKSSTSAKGAEQVLLMHLSKMHDHHDELLRRFLQQEMNIQLVLDRLGIIPDLGVKAPLHDYKTTREAIEEKFHSEEQSDGRLHSPTSGRQQKQPIQLQRDMSFISSSSYSRKIKDPTPSSVSGASSGLGVKFHKRDKGDTEQLATIVTRHAETCRSRAWCPQANAIWQFLENRNSGDLDMPARTFSMIQMGFEILFALEFMLRLASCPDRYEFWLTVFNWLDFLSICPVFLRIYLLVCDADDYLSILAVVPMLRMLRVMRRFHKFHLLNEAIAMAVEALPVLTFVLFLIAMMFSGLIYIVEPRSLIPSLPTALWFVLVTMSTVGYGDIVPSTALGTIIAAVLMVVSALYMAMPIGIVGNAFSKVWGDRDRLLLIAAIRENVANSGISNSLCFEMFQLFANSGSSELEDPFAEPVLTLEQFRRMLSTLQLSTSDDRSAALFRSMLVEGNSTLKYEDFSELLFPTYGIGQALSQKIKSSLDSVAGFRESFSRTLSQGAISKF